MEFQVEGDKARIIPMKTMKVPRDQAWFWTPEWREKEKKADLELVSGQYKDFDRLEDLLKGLHRED